MNPYFRGERLWGDDFSASQISDWYDDEEEAYANLYPHEPMEQTVGFDQLNWFHGFRHLQGRTFDATLALGSGFGTELLPIAGQLRDVTIVDASSQYSNGKLSQLTTVRYVKANPSGAIDLPTHSVDLVTAMSVLHHIPNVSYVLGELYRCLKPGGMALIREPICSMGDWRQPRNGLTLRERGLPRRWLEDRFRALGFHIRHAQPCVFPLVANLARFDDFRVWNNRLAVVCDALICRSLQWNDAYHRTTVMQKLAPHSCFWVLGKA
ncbi:MAG TPA: class I SAM-dependent methyltransferase [Povalibacter sp.]|nr:class I SAM-dependent methyltransferase [Povalibacter sp.]